MSEPLDLPNNVYFEDRLWISLRAAKISEGESVVFDVVPVHVSNKSWVPEVVEMKVTRVEADDNMMPKDLYNHDRDEIVYVVEPTNKEEKPLRAIYAFDAEYPHALLYLNDERNNVTMKLKSIKRDAYWEF